MLLRGIKDSNVYITVERQNNKDYNTLIQYVIAIQRQYMEVMKKGSTERKFRNKMRRVCEEGDCYLDKYHPIKRSFRHGDKDEDLLVTGDKIKFKVKFRDVVQRLCQ